MAILRSEDSERPSTLEITKGALESIGGQSWQRFQLKACCGDYKLELGSESSSGLAVDCLFCREPQDEVLKLAEKIEQIVNQTKDRLLFEPAEPSFELSVVRASASGLKVEIWLDSGEAASGIYRWDAAGIRFHTLQEHLELFLKELKQEFAC